MRVTGTRNIQKGNYIAWEKMKREVRKLRARVTLKSKAHEELRKGDFKKCFQLLPIFVNKIVYFSLGWAVKPCLLHMTPVL